MPNVAWAADQAYAIPDRDRGCWRDSQENRGAHKLATVSGHTGSTPQGLWPDCSARSCPRSGSRSGKKKKKERSKWYHYSVLNPISRFVTSTQGKHMEALDLTMCTQTLGNFWAFVFASILPRLSRDVGFFFLTMRFHHTLFIQQSPSLNILLEQSLVIHNRCTTEFRIWVTGFIKPDLGWTPCCVIDRHVVATLWPA